MPTADRTTIKAAIEELTNKLRVNLVASPPTLSKPFRRVEVSGGDGDEYARPFLTLLLLRARPVGVVDNDRLLAVSMEMRIATDLSTSDPHTAILDKVGAVEDYFDSIIDTGVIAGAEGFDDRTWTVGYPRVTAGARMATALATQTFVVKVERNQNREPAA